MEIKPNTRSSKFGAVVVYLLNSSLRQFIISLAFIAVGHWKLKYILMQINDRILWCSELWHVVNVLSNFPNYLSFTCHHSFLSICHNESISYFAGYVFLKLLLIYTYKNLKFGNGLNVPSGIIVVLSSMTNLKNKVNKKIDTSHINMEVFLHNSVQGGKVQ